MHIFHPFLFHLSQIEPWIESWLSTSGPIVVFVVAFIEGIPPIGLLAPSNIIILFAAFLAKIGVLNFYTIVTSALIGMTLGDIVGYYMGKKYGYAFLSPIMRIFSVRKESIERLKDLVSGHLGKAVFIGRFNPLTRPFAPFVVGASKVSFTRFIPFDLLAGVSLVALVSAIGYAFGASYGIAAMYLGRIIIVGILLVILFAIAYRFINHQFHVFARYELFAFILNVLGLSGFVLMLQGVSGMQHFMINPDVIVNVWFSNLANVVPWIVSVASYTSIVLGPAVLIAIGALISVYFFVHNCIICYWGISISRFTKEHNSQPSSIGRSSSSNRFQLSVWARLGRGHRSGSRYLFLCSGHSIEIIALVIYRRSFYFSHSRWS
jgi:membrane protein DedA with SNARE-associated domain